MCHHFSHFQVNIKAVRMFTSKIYVCMKNNRSAYLAALLLVIVGLIVYFVLKNDSDALIYTQNEAIDVQFNKQGKLLFIDGVSGETLSEIDIEVADDDQKRARGLMYRKAIPENGGMLFIHEYESIQSFWMKNTFIALDMIFVNSDNEIVTIHHNTSPMKDWSYTSTEPALYVVEVNAGYCHLNDITKRDKIEFTVFQ